MNAPTLKTQIDVIDGTPEKRVFLSIISDYDLTTGLCELVDNALDLWITNNRRPKLHIEISLDADRQLISVNDNAGGVKEAQTFNRPISLKKQETLASEIIATDDPTEGTVKNIIFDAVHPIKYPKTQQDFAQFIGEAAQTGKKFNAQLDEILAFKDDFDGEVIAEQ